MLSTPQNRCLFNKSYIVSQVFAAIVKNQPFECQVLASASTQHPSSTASIWTTETVTEVLRCVPRFLFRSPRSIGCQKGFRYRGPLKQRKLKIEAFKAQNGILVLGPAAHRDQEKVKLGLSKALEFYYWVETRFGFVHNERTCREMSLVLAKGNGLKFLWGFLKEMSKRGIVNTATVTCVVKVLGEEGLVDEALAAFYRMKQFHCKPDVFAYNTIINALCRVGNFKKAKLLLEQMELPGFRIPPDTFTYTILISSYCRYSLETGCRKATRRRMWEANHLFRIMLFKGFVPDIVTYNCLINGCCKTYRIGRALELLDDMLRRGCLPNRVTYNSFIRYYSSVNEIDKAIEMLRRMEELNHGTPSTSSYTPIIHALCEAGRALEAQDFIDELVRRGSVPREYTYKLVRDSLSSLGLMDLLNRNLFEQIEEGIEKRTAQLMKVKPIVNCVTTK
ncbi:hypothetical protein M9H77_24277 [Catharanthus roseus]|uniref:Uncharacterized protein n=1 Tax=Catharanthus roseus TaxID=4058 RepID=A0ACC0AWM5_CATRO|nr:hypothetical protein M9H77_24277 [Catharanthus roseus]